MSDYAIDTAARFGDIPFVEFSKELITGIFDSLVEAHVLQMEEYAEFVNSLTQDLSTYINNTVDGVSFDQISDFVLNYDLPEADITAISDALALLEAPDTTTPDVAAPGGGTAAPNQWWGALINTLGPAVTSLVDKIEDPSEASKYDALATYNQQVLDGVEITARTIPNYKDIQGSIAALIASNKYGLLQNMAKQGMMRLVVTEGEIETKITFSTFNNSSSGTSTSYSQKNTEKIRNKRVRGGGFLGIYKNKRKSRRKRRTVTVNTAKSYQRDSSGTRVDIFGRVLIRFKTDYAPLNG
ncbi:MAG: hypothetical protein ACRBFS_19850 [Aureispira sp.]